MNLRVIEALEWDAVEKAALAAGWESRELVLIVLEAYFYLTFSDI
jgi:hypothetical protein